MLKKPIKLHKYLRYFDYCNIYEQWTVTGASIVLLFFESKVSHNTKVR